MTMAVRVACAREARSFARRALLDFGLNDAFEARPEAEQAACLGWIEAAGGGREEERRVTRLIADLELGRPLPAR